MKDEKKEAHDLGYEKKKKCPKTKFYSFNLPLSSVAYWSSDSISWLLKAIKRRSQDFFLPVRITGKIKRIRIY